MQNNPERPLRVFLCHAKDDKPLVRKLYDYLRNNGIDAWLDEAKLLPGQKWEIEIPKALRSSDAIIVCLSKRIMTKEGYVQKEINFALDIVLEKPEGTIFLIPARFEECDVPSRLIPYQWVDLFRDRGVQWLLQGLDVRASELGLKISRNPLQDKPNKVELPASDLNEAKQARSLPPSHSTHSDQVLKTDNSFSSVIWAGIKFVKVPAGQFPMGNKISNPLSNKDESPRHFVDIPYEYWIGKFPITNEQFGEFFSWARYSYSYETALKSRPNFPAYATWDDTQAYCKWLNQMFITDLPKGLIFRLPTEAEWEKAARSSQGLEWPWGNDFDAKKCNSREGNKNNVVAVGSFSPLGDSPYGCADMVGNVYEWTKTIYKPYPYDAGDGREVISDDVGMIVCRGGSYMCEKNKARGAFRQHYDDIKNYLNIYPIGFRIACAPASPAT